MLNSQLIGRPVLSVHAGSPIGEIANIVINPHNLTIPAFRVTRRHSYGEEPEILLSQDIREISRRGVVINHEEDLAPPEDLIRLKEILELDFQLIAKEVRTESNKKLGKVEEYVVEIDQYTVFNLHVRRPAWRSLADSSLVINRQLIVEVNDYRVIVKDSAVKEGAPATQPVPSA